MTNNKFSERLALEGQQKFNTSPAPNSALKQPMNHKLTNLHDCNTC